MAIITNRTKKREGSALVLTIIFIAVSAILAGGIFGSAMSHRQIVTRQANLERALFFAEAGFERAAQFIADQDGFLSSSVVSNSATISGGSYSYVITQEAGWKNFSVESIGVVNGVSRKVEVDRIYLPTFATYAMWNGENGVIYFLPGEVFDGLVHADDELYFESNSTYGGPTFSNRVTSGTNSFGGSTNYVDFQDGFELNADGGTLASIDFTLLETRAGSYAGNLLLEGHTSIAFNNDQMLITNERQGWTNQSVSISANQLVYVKDSVTGVSTTRPGRVHVQGGTVDGRVTVVSDEDMLLHNHIYYANDPRNDSEHDPATTADDDLSDDALGLISRDDIWVALDAPDDLDLFAAVLAVGQAVSPASGDERGQFGVLEYWDGPTRGFINLYGSLVQDKRGVVGTFGDDGVMLTDYMKNYQYDKRFENAAPPYYPELDNQVRFEGWVDGPV